MIAHNLQLAYSLSPGWLAPFASGLLRGQPVAARCKQCQRVSYPPIRVCICGHPGSEWIELPGQAHIVFRTAGEDGDFALVQFEGADTNTVVRLVEFSNKQTVGQLTASTTSQPKMQLHPLTHPGPNRADLKHP